jgi:hypothetical protein
MFKNGKGMLVFDKGQIQKSGILEKFAKKGFFGAPKKTGRTDKKENKIFLIYNVIQKGAVKLYMNNGLLIYD